MDNFGQRIRSILSSSRDSLRHALHKSGARQRESTLPTPVLRLAQEPATAENPARGSTTEPASPSPHPITNTLLSRRSIAYVSCGVVLLLGASAIFFPGCSQTPIHTIVPPGTPLVRVCLLEKRVRVDLSATQSPTIQVGNSAPTAIELGGSTVPVALTASGWKIGETPVGAGELRINPASEGSVSIEGHAYRGRYRLVPRPGGKFDVINDVDVDGYLMGVVAKEMFPDWHEEAYRAQAIVARTYAIYVTRTGAADASYDLFADTRSQVYGGIAGETAKARAAVEATRGVVVAYGPPGEEKIFKAYFSSCCGGITQSSADAFGDPLEQPLTAQNVGSLCSASKHFTWPAVTIPNAEITRRMRLWGAANNAPEKTIGDVVHVDVLSTNAFGRPASFAITDSRGLQYRLASEDFRLAVNTDASGGPRLLSSFCKPVNDKGAVRFTDGHGFGHGVGMCQWCAQAQATSGMPHEQIVLKAFPKAVLVHAY